MNDPRPPSSQGLPHAQPPRPPQGQPAQRPGAIPQRPPSAGAPQVAQPRGVPLIPGRPAPADEEPIALEGDDEPISLEEAARPVAPAPPRLPAAGPSGGAAPAASQAGMISPASKIKFYAGGDKHTYTKFKREPHSSIMGATRVRSFHGRLSDDGLAYTDDKINEWLDNHPEVEIKHVNCLVGPLEGKVTGEQGLIVVIWY